MADDIYYHRCPHFTVGHVDQWGEQGYLLHDGLVYGYEENRKDQCGSTSSPMSPSAFLLKAKQEGIAVPDDFRALVVAASAMTTRRSP